MARTRTGPSPAPSGPAKETPQQRADRLLRTEIPFINSPVFERWRIHPLQQFDISLQRLESTTWLDRREELLWFRLMNYKKFRANQWRGRLSLDDANIEAMDRLECLLADANEIRNRLLTVYVKLGASLAARFANSVFAMDELSSEANSVLIRCIEKFDADRGFRFSTYATHSVRRRLGRYVKGRSQRAVCMPQNLLEAIANDEERWTYDREREVTNCFREIERLMGQLNEREERIVRARYGLASQLKPQTLQSLAAELGVSRERVRQLEQRALGKLARMAKEARLDA